MYKVVLVEPDKRLQPQLSGAIREEPALELVAVFQEAETAMGRSSVFAPNLFLVNVEAAANRSALPELIRRVCPRPFGVEGQGVHQQHQDIRIGFFDSPLAGHLFRYIEI